MRVGGGSSMSIAIARELRKDMTDAEKRLWQHVRFRQLRRYKFRRQCPIGRYVVDFVCFERRLVIELDGSQHADGQLSYDLDRTRWLGNQGFRVLRFWNNDVLENTESVVEEILKALTPHLSPSGGHPPPQGGRKNRKNTHSPFPIPHSFFFFFVVVLVSPALFAATVSGRALFDGTPGENPKIDMSADPVCQSLHPAGAFQERVIVNANGTLKNVFVYVKEGLEKTFHVPSTEVVLDQKGCSYHPRIQGMQTGQKLTILNSDPTLHNVHAFAKSNKEFNLGMPFKGMKLEKTFSNPEVMVKMKCDVHPWMTAYLGVVDHPFFALTDESGVFRIEDLPPGEYTFEAWHETYGTKAKQVFVEDDTPVEVNFQFSSREIVDEASGLKIKTTEPKPLAELGGFDDQAALNVPRPKGRWWLPPNISTYGKEIDLLFYIILWITGIIFVGVQGTLLTFLVRYRTREGAHAHYTHGSKRLEVIWTIIPSIILVVLTILSQRVWSQVRGAVPEGAIPIQVEAEQFAWNVRYPGPDGKFETTDDIKTLNQLHIPVGKPVRVRLKSIGKDENHPVIHSFFLPEFRLKQDVVPGMGIDVWFEATRTGQYEIACAEFCGLGHYRMRGFLSIHSQEGFDAWLKEQAVE